MPLCSFVSEQPKDFVWEYGKNIAAHTEFIKQLQEAIEQAVELNGITEFYSGMSHGADLDFAEAVLAVKENKYPTIRLICAVNNDDLFIGWSKQDIERYNAILEKADKQKALPDIKVLDNSDQLIAAWNGQESGILWSELYYAMQNRKLIYFVRLNEIKQDTDEPNGRLKRELQEAKQSSEKGFFTRLAYMTLIQALIKEHPNTKATFKAVIEKNPAFAKDIVRLAETLEIDIG